MLEIAILNISVISKDQRSYLNNDEGAGYRSINPVSDINRMERAGNKMSGR